MSPDYSFPYSLSAVNPPRIEHSRKQIKENANDD